MGEETIKSDHIFRVRPVRVRVRACPPKLTPRSDSDTGVLLRFYMAVDIQGPSVESLTKSDQSYHFRTAYRFRSRTLLFSYHADLALVIDHRNETACPRYTGQLMFVLSIITSSGFQRDRHTSFF